MTIPNQARVLNMEDFRDIEDLVRMRLHCDHIVIAGTLGDGTNVSYISDELSDKDLVYLIQTLIDLRQVRLNE